MIHTGFFYSFLAVYLHLKKKQVCSFSVVHYLQTISRLSKFYLLILHSSTCHFSSSKTKNSAFNDEDGVRIVSVETRGLYLKLGTPPSPFLSKPSWNTCILEINRALVLIYWRLHLMWIVRKLTSVSPRMLFPQSNLFISTLNRQWSSLFQMIHPFADKFVSMLTVT